MGRAGEARQPGWRVSHGVARLHSAADTLDVLERQRIVRLVVKEVLIGEDTIVIRHSIPVASTPPTSGGPPAPSRPEGEPHGQSYLLRKGRDDSPLRGSGLGGEEFVSIHESRLEPLPQNRCVRRDLSDHPVVVDIVVAAFDVSL